MVYDVSDLVRVIELHTKILVLVEFRSLSGADTIPSRCHTTGTATSPHAHANETPALTWFWPAPTVLARPLPAPTIL